MPSNATPSAPLPVWRAYLGLCKLRVVGAIVFTAVIGMFLAVPGWPPLAETLWGAIGIGLAAGLVANGADLARDAQLAARGYFETVATPEGGRETFDGIPFRASSLSGRVAAPGPLLGEHTDLVLRDLLGLREADLATLRTEGVIA